MPAAAVVPSAVVPSVPSAVVPSVPSAVVPRQERVAVTARARRALARTCRELGRHAVYMSWPAGATVLPADVWKPGEYDVIVGHTARCPIYADLRQLALFARRRAVIDVLESRRPRRRPVLRMSTVDSTLAGPTLVA